MQYYGIITYSNWIWLKFLHPDHIHLQLQQYLNFLNAERW